MKAGRGGLLRNRDVRRELVAWGVVTAAVCAAGVFVSPACGGFAACGAVCAGGVHAVFLRRRYRDLAALCGGIDRVLHGQEDFLLSDNEEGELSILKSEIRKMTVRLREAADLLQQDKRRLSDAMADISHQLRTPLTTMQLTLSLLASESLSDERRLALTYELRESLERVDWLVETLLKLSGIDAGAITFAPETRTVAEWVRRAVEPFAVPMELREQKLTVRVGEERFFGDLRWCAEALENLLKNCVEHTPTGGEIRVESAETALFVELTVRDSGPGFDRRDLPRLFERFYRGRNAAAGSAGIGLAFARAVLEAQGASLRAENAPEGGALFRIRFPKGVI